jgi:hypothetical protein
MRHPRLARPVRSLFADAVMRRALGDLKAHLEA